MPRFVAVGEAMVDVLVAGPGGHDVRIRLAPGGSAPNAAVWAAALGARASVVARVGNDVAGAMVARALAERGVEALLAVDADRPTGTFVALESGVMADRGANARLAPGDVPEPLEADVVLVSGYLLLRPDSEPGARAALARASATWIAVDAGSAGLAPRLPEVSAGANAVLANEDEARALTGLEAEGAARALGERYRLACVKRGAGGAVALLDGRLESAAAPPVADPSPTGAGDAFAAGLLVALARGADLREALAGACRLGACAAASPGTWPAIGGEIAP